MKLSNGGQKYNDNLYTVTVDSLGLKLCSNDIEELKQIFTPDEPAVVEEQVPQAAQQPGFYSCTKYTFDVSKAYIFLGMSELPVPLLDLSLKETKGIY